MKKIIPLLIVLLSGTLFTNADPCDSIITIQCDTSLSFIVSGVGDSAYYNGFDGSNSCYAIGGLGGKEQIYKFTPTVTGSYEFEILGAAGPASEYVEFLIKDSILGCGPIGWDLPWNCLGINLNGNTGSLTSRTLDNNHTYYIMINSETTSSINYTFKIDCARVICDSIQTINCGDTVTFHSPSGYGHYDYYNGFDGSNSCYANGGLGGKEQIYKFTPTITGSYEFEILGAAGPTSEYVEFLIKDSILGCDPIGWNLPWNCLGVNLNGNTGSLTSRTLDNNHTYYIMVNSETTSSINYTFKIDCARVICDSIQTINCGVPIVFHPPIGYGDYDYQNGFDVSGICYCNGGFGGKEQIYKLDPSVTPYYVHITATNGVCVEYFWKNFTLGCDNTGWVCLGPKTSTGLDSIPASNFSILLLLNSESDNTTTQNFYVDNCTVGISELNPFSNFSFHPNPAKNKLAIELSEQNNFNSTLTISNVIGEQIYSNPISQSLEVDVSKFNNGIYFIQIVDEKRVTTKKFVKE